MKEKCTLQQYMESVEPTAREIRQGNSEKEPAQPGGQLPPAGLKWNPDRGNELLVAEVLGPLLDIIYLYKESCSYNYVPGTTEDCDAGWKYFENRFHDIYRALNQNLYITHGVYVKVLRIIEEIQCFVRSFSGVEGLAERYFAERQRMNDENNFQHDKDDFFVAELAYALRRIFLKDLAEYTA